MTTIDEIRDNFSLLDEWDDATGTSLNSAARSIDAEEEHSATNKVQGCASQVWLSKQSTAAAMANRG